MVELKTDNGITKDSEQIKQMVQDFYRNLYERGDVNSTTDGSAFCSNMNLVSAESKLNILKPLTTDELLCTLKTCSDSAPGPDGIPYLLIKLTWSLYGPLLINSSTGVCVSCWNPPYLPPLPTRWQHLSGVLLVWTSLYVLSPQ